MILTFLIAILMPAPLYVALYASYLDRKRVIYL